VPPDERILNFGSAQGVRELKVRTAEAGVANVYRPIQHRDTDFGNPGGVCPKFWKTRQVFCAGTNQRKFLRFVRLKTVIVPFNNKADAL
jgi:hypothetical protein